MKRKKLTGINHRSDLKMMIGSEIVNSWVINFAGESEERIPFAFCFRLNVYSLSMGFRQICMLNTTVSVTKGDEDWYHHEDKFVEIKAKKKIRYDELSVSGDFAKIDGDYNKLNIWSLIPWATIDFTLESDGTILYDNVSGKTSTCGMDVYGYNAPFWDGEGSIEIDNKVFKVKGAAWMERFVWPMSRKRTYESERTMRLSFIMDNGTRVSIRSIIDNASGEEHSWADFIIPSGDTGHVELEPLSKSIVRFWKSESGQAFPLYINVKIPEIDLDVCTRPLIENQEARAKKQNECRYFGAGSVEGGVCFMEFTGSWAEN